MPAHFLGEFGDLSLTVVVTSPPFYENCYVVRHRSSRSVVIVDPGSDAEGILAVVAAEPYDQAEIWLTHGHLDHIGAVRTIEVALGIPTRAHACEKELIGKADEMSRAFLGEGLEAPEAIDYFEGEPILNLTGLTARTVFTPGHTPGGVCLDFGGFALTGDTIFKQGVGRTDLFGGSQDALWASITRFLELANEETILFSGHGPGWSVRDARRWWQMMA